jgi:hypothetical protein
MTKSELKYQVELTGSFFFTRDSMKFFGDTMANYGVRSNGNNWELWRKKPVKYGLTESAYFDKLTYKRVFVK